MEERYIFGTVRDFAAFAKAINEKKGYRLHSWHFGAYGAVAYVLEAEATLQYELVAPHINLAALAASVKKSAKKKGRK